MLWEIYIRRTQDRIVNGELSDWKAIEVQKEFVCVFVFQPKLNDYLAWIASVFREDQVELILDIWKYLISKDCSGVV